jgi:ribosomal-protein-alanine N-acetyltransferase
MSDAAELARLHAQLFRTPWSTSSFEQSLAHPACTALVARTGLPLQLVGFIIGQLAADEAEILTLGVRQDWQRQGVGRSLVGALGRAAKKAEARRLYLEVASSNSAALALYRKLGFHACGRRKAYYERAGEQAEDAINFALPL